MNQVIVLVQLQDGRKAIFFAPRSFDATNSQAMDTVADGLDCDMDEFTIVSIQDSPFNHQMPYLEPFICNEEL